MSEISVFIAESVSAEDFYHGQTDGRAAHEVLRVHQVPTDYRVVLDRALLKRAVKDANEFSVFHLSCHGDEDGIELSDGDVLDWSELAAILKPLAEPSRLLVMASCSGGYVGLTRALEARKAPFGYVFGSTAETVRFTHSCLAWSVLYNRLIEGAGTKSSVRRTIDRINEVAAGDFVYRRWDGNKYLKYASRGARPRRM